jgi:hypothetical protein
VRQREAVVRLEIDRLERRARLDLLEGRQRPLQWPGRGHRPGDRVPERRQGADFINHQCSLRSTMPAVMCILDDGRLARQ